NVRAADVEFLEAIRAADAGERRDSSRAIEERVLQEAARGEIVDVKVETMKLLRAVDGDDAIAQLIERRRCCADRGQRVGDAAREMSKPDRAEARIEQQLAIVGDYIYAFAQRQTQRVRL